MIWASRSFLRDLQTDDGSLGRLRSTANFSMLQYEDLVADQQGQTQRMLNS